MAYKRMSVGGVDFMIDTTTGALLTNLGGATGVTIDADIVQVDIDALIAGIAGGTTQADLETALIAGIAGGKTQADLEALQIERYEDIQEMDDASEWTEDGVDVSAAPTDDTSTFVPHEDITQSLKFSKDGATVATGLISAAVTKDLSAFNAAFVVEAAVKHADFANMDYFFLRLGTDASNYHEWRIDAEDLTAGEWNEVQWAPGEFADQQGTGCDMSTIAYAAVGVSMDATQALSNINVGEIRAFSAPHSTTIGSSEVVTTTPNVNVQKVGNKKITTGAGAVGTGSEATQRVTLASNDPAVTALGLLATAAVQSNIENNTQEIDSKLANVELEHLGDSRTPRSLAVLIADASSASSSSGEAAGFATKLISETSKPYIKAKVQASKPSAAASSSSSSSSSSSGESSSSSSGEAWSPTGTALPEPATGDVWVWAKDDPMEGAWRLNEDEWLELPPNCDLSDFAFAVENDGEGLVVLYTEGEDATPSSSSSSSSSA